MHPWRQIQHVLSSGFKVHNLQRWSMELSSISWYAEAFRVSFTGTKGPSPAPEKQPHHSPSSIRLYTWHNAVRQVPFSWQQQNPDSSIRLPDGEVWLITPENTSQLHPMLCIALADVWLGCSCSAIEIHSMKLSTHCSWANLKATWSLEVCSDWLCRKLVTSTDPAPPF